MYRIAREFIFFLTSGLILTSHPNLVDLMLLLPMGSALQQAAVTCFAIQFWGTDHSFLHQCQVFSTISKILSRGEAADHDADHSPKGEIISFTLTSLFLILCVFFVIQGPLSQQSQSCGEITLFLYCS
jgi:hypothetical protein